MSNTSNTTAFEIPTGEERVERDPLDKMNRDIWTSLNIISGLTDDNIRHQSEYIETNRHSIKWGQSEYRETPTGIALLSAITKERNKLDITMERRSTFKSIDEAHSALLNLD